MEKSGTFDWFKRSIKNLLPQKGDSGLQVVLKLVAVLSLLSMVFLLFPIVITVLVFLVVKNIEFKNQKVKTGSLVAVVVLGLASVFIYWGPYYETDTTVSTSHIPTPSESQIEDEINDISDLLDKTKKQLEEFNENLEIASNYGIDTSKYGEVEQLNVNEESSYDDVKEVLGVITSNNEQLENDIENAKNIEYKVTEVVDGDTIKIAYNGSEQSVRLIGIDTPETQHPSEPVECFGQEAYEKMKSLVGGENVKIMFDSSQESVDNYGRLLLYIWVDDIFVNKEMIEEGYAYEYTYSTPYMYQTEFKEAQKVAENSGKGLWGDVCACERKELSRTCSSCNTATVTYQNWDCSRYTGTIQDVSCTTGCSTSSPSATCQYSCTSPDRNCDDFSSHAQAVAFFKCCGFTAKNDPMKLDGSGVDDGDPCESLP
jgi:micrococcal nuclease